MDPKGKTAWITGASSGIGQALAIALAKNGAQVILSARRLDRLQATAAACRDQGVRVVTLPLDLALPESLSQAAKEAEVRMGQVDLLVNAGGIGQRGLALETEGVVGRRIFEIDFWSAVELTRLVVPGMVQRGSGQVVVVSSLTGKFGAPRRAFYAAAKHALHGWFDSLREELLGSGVSVTLLVPGWVKTEISENALEADGSRHGSMDTGQSAGISPDECARRAMPAIINDVPEQLVGGHECGGVYLNRIWPGLFRKILRKRGIG